MNPTKSRHGSLTDDCHKQNKNEWFSLKRAAEYLGLGYDRAKQRVDYSSRILDDISSNFEEYVFMPKHSMHGGSIACSKTSEKANEKLNNKLKLPFNATFTSVSLGAGYEKKSGGKIGNAKGEIFHKVCYIDYSLCSYRKVPPLNLFSPSDSKMRGEFVNSVWVSTGYKISFHIKYQRNEEADNSNSEIKANVKIPLIAQLEFEKSNLEKKLKNKKIEEITVNIEDCLSEFKLTVPHLVNKTTEGIWEACNAIHKEYLEKIETISSRCLHVDPDICLALTKDLPIPKIPSIFELNLEPTIAIHASKPNFIELGKNMLKTMSLEYKQTLEATLGKITLWEMLTSLERVFGFAFQKRVPKLVPGDSSIVFGATGHGKSTLVGYKNGYHVNLLQTEDGDFAYYYSQKDHKTCPPMGSEKETSKTKGYDIHGKTIDTAGLFDRQGKAEELCNGVAVDFAIKSFQPGRVIVVLRPEAFDTKGKEFFRLMKKLKQFLWNPEHPDIFPSILFVFNQKIEKPNNELITKNDIKRKIQNKITQLEQELDEDTKQYSGWTDWFSKNASWVGSKVGLGNVIDLTQFTEWARNKANSTIKDFDPTLAEKIIENLENKALLEQLKGSENIVVADFRTSETRKEIEKWEQTASKLPSSAFKVSNTMDDKRRPFFDALFVAVNYFNEQFKKVNGLETQIRTLKLDIEKTKKIITLIPDVSISTPADIENYKSVKTKEEADKLIQDGIKAAAENKIKNLKKEKSDLENDDSKTHLQDLTPSEPITSRSWWAYFDWSARKYYFDYKGISLLEVEYVKPTAGGEYPGVFLEPSDVQPLPKVAGELVEKCTFHATYRPKYYGYEEDTRAIVKLYVKNKHHPNTVMRISNIAKNDLPDEEKALKEASDAIGRHNAFISGWELKINSNTEASQNQKVKEAYVEKLKSYQMQFSNVCDEIGNIKSELATYDKYCQLLRQILTNFQSHQMLIDLNEKHSANKKTKKLTQEFIANFS